MLKVERFPSGPLDTNAYLVWKDESQDCVVFDCPQAPQKLLDFLEQHALQPQKLFLTHAHADHIAGLDQFCQRFPWVTIFQHPLEASWLTDSTRNLSAWLGEPQTTQVRPESLFDGQEFEALGQLVNVLHTPGHSPGSVVFHWKEARLAIVGDLIFRGSIGRWDLPCSDKLLLYQSLEKIMSLSDETQLYPGHGEPTSLGIENASNPYLVNKEKWKT